MKSVISALLLALTMSVGVAHAASQADCEAKAIDKNGKALAGAAKTANVKKCMADSAPAPAAESGCAAKAIDKNGKALAGAAKTAFLKKCEKDAGEAKK